MKTIIATAVTAALLSSNVWAEELLEIQKPPYTKEKAEQYKKDAPELIKRLQKASGMSEANSSHNLTTFPCCVAWAEVKIPFDGSYCQCVAPHQGPCDPKCAQ